MGIEEEEEKPIGKIGDTVYRIYKEKIIRCKIVQIEEFTRFDKTKGYRYFIDNSDERYYVHDIDERISKSYFAMAKVLKRKLNIKHKRQMLREYEIQLNEMFGLKDHFVVK